MVRILAVDIASVSPNGLHFKSMRVRISLGQINEDLS